MHELGKFLGLKVLIQIKFLTSTSILPIDLTTSYNEVDDRQTHKQVNSANNMCSTKQRKLRAVSPNKSHKNTDE